MSMTGGETRVSFHPTPTQKGLTTTAAHQQSEVMDELDWKDLFDDDIRTAMPATSIASHKEELDAIVDGMTGSNESSLYHPIAIMLNTISEICSSRSNSEDQSDSSKVAIIYFLQTETTLAADPFDFRIKPDIVAKYGSKDEAMEEIKYLKQSPAGRGRHVANHTTSALSTRRLPTFIECLTVIKINYKDDEEGYLQELNYLNNLKQNHPDTRLLYGLSARRSGYRLHKLSACQILISKELPWSSDGYLPFSSSIWPFPNLMTCLTTGSNPPS
jgi:hypothetical protein